MENTYKDIMESNVQYGVQTWERIVIGNRIDTAELIPGGDEWWGNEADAIECAAKIVAEKPEGVCRVTVGRFNENAEMLDDGYIYDRKI